MWPYTKLFKRGIEMDGILSTEKCTTIPKIYDTTILLCHLSNGKGDSLSRVFNR